MLIYFQVKILNTVSENFEMAMKSSQNKEEYRQQFESIVRGVDVSLHYCSCVVPVAYVRFSQY